MAKEPSDEFDAMLKALHASSIMKLSKEDVEALKTIAKKLNTLNDKQKQEVHEILHKAGVLGKIVQVFEILTSVIQAATFVRNLAWLILPIALLVGYLGNWYSTIVQAIPWLKH